MTRRALGPLVGAVAVLAVGSLVGIGVVAGDDDASRDLTASSQSTTSSTAAADTTTTSASGAAPSTSAPTATTARPGATVAPGGDGLGAPQDPGPTVVPKSGVYDYERTAGRRSAITTTEVTDQGAGRQRFSFKGEQNEFTNSVVWSDTAMTITSSTYQLEGERGSASGECDWDPDMHEYALPLRVGVSWTVNSRCAMRIEAQAVTIERTGEAEVTALERIKIAGQVVDVWVIERHETSATRFARGSLDTDTRVKEWFSPKHGLKLRVEGTAKTKSTFGDRTRENEAAVGEEILNLEPKAS